MGKSDLEVIAEAPLASVAAMAEAAGLRTGDRSAMGAPSPRAFAEAGMLAGLTARQTGETGVPARLMDALLLLQAREAGRVLLTRNIADFDRLQRLEPTSRVLYYR